MQESDKSALARAAFEAIRTISGSNSGDRAELMLCLERVAWPTVVSQAQ